MGYWSIITPVAVTNLVTNPSIELAATGYTAVGGAVARVTTQARRGGASLGVTPAAGVGDGCYYGSVALTDTVTYTFGFDFKGVLGIPYTAYFATTVPAVKGTPITFTGTGEWVRYSVTWTADATANHRLYIVKNNSASVGVYYVDGVLLWAGAYDVSYVDGDQTDCVWNGAKHASTSYRSAQSRAGGREVNFSTYGIKVISDQGIGMPPASHLVQKQPLLPGGHFQGRKVMSRTIDLNISVVGGATYETLHQFRKDLIDAIKPDLTAKDEPFILKYTGANSAKPVYIKVVYDSGLEMTNPEWTVENFTLRFIAYDDPYFWEDGNNTAAIAVTQNVADADYIIQKIAGVWSALGTGADNEVWDVAYSEKDGLLYAVGAFHNVGGVAAAHVASWNGTVWAALGVGVDDTALTCTIGPGGNLYVGGNFHNAGGAGAAHIATWDGSAWAALGAGCDNNVYAVEFGPDGCLYAGGEFLNAGGAGAAYIAKWTGAAWAALGAGTDGPITAIAFGPYRYDSTIVPAGNYQTVYVGGNFDHAGGVDATNWAEWDGSAWLVNAGIGTDDTVNHMIVGRDGALYIGGAFHNGFGIVAAHIIKWGGSWKALQTGMDAAVYALAVDRDGLIYAGGLFTIAGGLVLNDSFAMWNGTTWGNLDCNLPGAAQSHSVYIYADRMYLCYTTAGVAVTSASNTVNNPGTSTTYPVIHIKNSTAAALAISWMKNETTGKKLTFVYTVQSGEEIIIDLRPNQRKATSNYYGSIWRALTRESDIGSFGLLPGANVITAYGGSGLTAWMEYGIKHWSVDGVAL